MQENRKAKPESETKNQSLYKEQNTKKIPRTLLQTPPVNFIIAKNKNFRIRLKDNFLLLRGKGAIKPLKEVWKPILVHGWQIKQELNLRYESSANEKNIRIMQKISGYANQINKLRIELKWCDGITSKGMRVFGQVIARNLTQLQYLTLTFFCCSEISDTELTALVLEISTYLIGLKQLKLEFGGRFGKITDQGIQNISKKIGRHLINLKQLSLAFEDCENITNTGLSSIAPNVGKHILGLEHLSLKFTNCQNITDKGIGALALGVAKHLASISHLNLCFSLCKCLTDMTLKALGSSIGKSLTLLQHLSLEFDECIQITDEGLEAFSKEAFKQLKLLTELSLSFKSVYKITDKGIKPLVNEIARLSPHLQHLYLTFLYGSLTDELRKRARNLFKNIPNLEIL